MPAVKINGDRAEVEFRSFGRANYDTFLKCKQLPECELSYDWERDRYRITTPARFASMLGAQPLAGPVKTSRLAGHLFDYQRWIVKRALDARRFAIWADTGLGKTAMFLEWARQVRRRTDGRVLILSPLQIVGQTCDEWGNFYSARQPAPMILNTRDELVEWCQTGDSLAICNYEKLASGQIPEFRHLAGIVLDESSILKTGGGKIKWNLIHSSKGVEYKLSCTATPAPNEAMEYASQASFLEVLRSGDDILWTYFTRDKRGNWSVKPHARDAFYRFMSSWSIYLRDPAAYGFKDILSTLPPPEWHEHRIPLTEAQREAMNRLMVDTGRGLFDDRMGVRERAKLSQIAKGFMYDGDDVRLVASKKPQRVATLVENEVAENRQTLVWTAFDAEARILAAHFDEHGIDYAQLHGETSAADRQCAIDSFKAGEVDVLVSKAQLLGYGLNFQNARAMVFSGFDDSFERMYQAVRRAYRFGQRHPVQVHVPVVPELEGLMLDNLRKKQERFEQDVAIQETNYRRALEVTL